MGKLPTGSILGGVLLNQKLNPATLENESDKQKLMVLLRTFFEVHKRLAYSVQHRVARDAAGSEENTQTSIVI
ncbi:pyruvate formate-lyase [Klebsiella michiganensis]|uniref:Pyruvate formate-lyase n=1 Tax=Klebsiella michiganensis TaxID=1134687 RepID=A0A7H4N386_9ENTR|nr:pyruvate formate-lyase [Klebsiella michiganensis]